MIPPTRRAVLAGSLAAPALGRADTWAAVAEAARTLPQLRGILVAVDGETALAEASGESLLTVARNWLGAPLGTELAPWTRDPQGFYLDGNEMALPPRAMLTVGEMLRRGGEWEKSWVLSRAWVEASLRPATRSPFSGLDHGYGWFPGPAPEGRLALARGYGGQVIATTRRGPVTVPITSDPNQPARSEGYLGELMGLVEGEVLPRA